MKPETIEKLAADIYSDISQWEYPADRILDKFFRSNRSLNSKNRRAIKTLVYEKIRSVKGYPEFLEKYIPQNWQEEFAAMQSEAPVDLRVNTLKATREKINLEGAENTPHSPVGLRLSKRLPLEFTGLYEVQDEGSQLVVQFAAAKAGERVLDFCAGGGGKTLALAAEMQNKGHITAYDAQESRMKNLPKRLERAGVKIAKIEKPQGEYDLVFVDSPCSGSGTWRRNPDLKWRMKENEIEELLKKQRIVLQSAAKYVKPGGRLVYVTCSLFPAENEKQIQAFFKENPDWKLKEELRLSPLKTNTDGFYAASLF